MSHLMHDGRQQIDATSRVARRISVAASSRSFLGEEYVARRPGIDKPAVAAGAAADANMITVGFSETNRRELRDLEFQPVQRDTLIIVEAGRLPARRCSRHDRI